MVTNWLNHSGYDCRIIQSTRAISSFNQGITDLTLTVAYYTALAIAQIALKPEMGGGRVSTL